MLTTAVQTTKKTTEYLRLNRSKKSSSLLRRNLHTSSIVSNIVSTILLKKIINNLKIYSDLLPLVLNAKDLILNQKLTYFSSEVSSDLSSRSLLGLRSQS